VAHPLVAEAAVVGFPHDIKGTGIYAYVICKPEADSWDAEQLVGALKEQVRHAIGPIATPDRIQVTPGLPKTRSARAPTLERGAPGARRGARACCGAARRRAAARGRGERQRRRAPRRGREQRRRGA